MHGKMGEVKRKTLYFAAPRLVEVREESLPVPGADEVLVETTCSAISAGTEMLIYQGRFPRDLETDSTISALRGGFKYPLSYGYACAGIVRETGSHVDSTWQDKLVFAFQPHSSHFTTTTNNLFPIPSSLSPEAACFLPNMETAINLVQDGAPIFGERVLVLGQGIIGLLTAALLNEFPLDVLVTADCYALRCNSSPVTARFSLDPYASGFRQEALNFLKQGADLTFELSGNPTALNDAIALTTFSGRIVVGSWYGEKQVELNLGSTFHRSRIKLISSQVSTIAPELEGRWDKARRFDAAWKALERVQPEKWITHRFAIDDAAEAYRLLDERPQDAIQVLIIYGQG
jgi:2-desacetyl-2-hydroxyethyl bacteriochlorophyllide A dehydrogenase